MPLTDLDLLLWLTGFLGHVALLLVLLLRGRARTFPIFTALMILNVIRTVVLFLINREGSKAMYFYAFWSLASADIALQFGIVYELASKIFRPLGTWASDIRTRLAMWAGASVCLALLLTWIPKPQSQFWMQVLLLKGSFFSAALMSELFVGMIALSSVAGLSWSSHAAKIAKGLAFYSVVTLIFETANTSFGLNGNDRIYGELSRLRMVLYLCCVMYWILSLWRNAPPASRMPDLMREQVSVISRALEGRLDVFRSEGRS
jgi:hypothetical protein